MIRGLPALLLLLATLAPSERGEDHHPGQTHAEHEDAHHSHEHHDEGHHHHDEHACCGPGAMLALQGEGLNLDVPAGEALRLTTDEPRFLPSARELFHVPLA